MSDSAANGFDAGAVADRLAQLYDQAFGGNRRGRFRISMKLLRRIAGRRRLTPRHIRAIGEEVFERGFVLIDLETFFVVLSQRTFASYRRVNEASLLEAPAAQANVRPRIGD